MTLRWRIALLLGLVAFGVGAFAAVASYLTTASQLRTEIDNSLKTKFDNLKIAMKGTA